jgi:hypothetical protein
MMDELFQNALLVAAAAYADQIRRDPKTRPEAQFLAQIIWDNVHADQVNRSVEYLRAEYKRRNHDTLFTP